MLEYFLCVKCFDSIKKERSLKEVPYNIKYIPQCSICNEISIFPNSLLSGYLVGKNLVRDIKIYILDRGV
jgi:hypothetical protein